MTGALVRISVMGVGVVVENVDWNRSFVERVAAEGESGKRSSDKLMTVARRVIGISLGAWEEAVGASHHLLRQGI